MIDCYDVDNLIDIIYDYNYNLNSSKCYETKPVILLDINDIDLIKITPNKINSVQLINNIFNDNLTFLRSEIYPTGYKYIFKKSNVDIVIHTYINNDKITNLNSCENVNKRISKLFSDFVIYKQSNNILINIINIDFEYNDLDKFIETHQNIHNLKNDAINSNCLSISISEHFFKMRSLSEHLTDDLMKEMKDEHYLSIIVQIFKTLQIIQNKYPTFRHNNLQIENMYGYIGDSLLNLKIDYFNFSIFNVGFTYKMNNFEYANISDIIDNDDIDEQLKTFDNLYDVKQFISSLINHCSKHMNKNVINFCNKILTNNIPLNLLLEDVIFNSITKNKK